LKRDSIRSFFNIILKGATHYVVIFLITSLSSLETLGDYKTFFNISVLLWIVLKFGFDQTYYRWASTDWTHDESICAASIIVKFRIFVIIVAFLIFLFIGMNSKIFFVWALSSNSLIKNFITEAYYPSQKLIVNSLKINFIYSILTIVVIIIGLNVHFIDTFLLIGVTEIIFAISILYLVRKKFQTSSSIYNFFLKLTKNKKLKKFIFITFITSVASINTYKLVEAYLIGENRTLTFVGEFVMISVVSAFFLSVSPANIVRPYIQPFLSDSKKNNNILNNVFYINSFYSVCVLYFISSDIAFHFFFLFLKLSFDVIELVPIIFGANCILAQIAFITIIMVNEGKIKVTVYGMLVSITSYVIGPLILSNYGLITFVSVPLFISTFLLILYNQSIYSLGYKRLALYTYFLLSFTFTFILLL